MSFGSRSPSTAQDVACNDTFKNRLNTEMLRIRYGLDTVKIRIYTGAYLQLHVPEVKDHYVLLVRISLHI